MSLNHQFFIYDGQLDVGKCAYLIYRGAPNCISCEIHDDVISFMYSSFICLKCGQDCNQIFNRWSDNILCGSTLEDLSLAIDYWIRFIEYNNLYGWVMIGYEFNGNRKRRKHIRKTEIKNSLHELKKVITSAMASKSRVIHVGI